MTFIKNLYWAVRIRSEWLCAYLTNHRALFPSRLVPLFFDFWYSCFCGKQGSSLFGNTLTRVTDEDGTTWV